MLVTYDPASIYQTNYLIRTYITWKKLRKWETRAFLHKYVKSVQSFAKIHGELIMISLKKKDRAWFRFKEFQVCTCTFFSRGCDLQTWCLICYTFSSLFLCLLANILSRIQVGSICRGLVFSGCSISYHALAVYAEAWPCYSIFKAWNNCVTDFVFRHRLAGIHSEHLGQTKERNLKAVLSTAYRDYGFGDSDSVWIVMTKRGRLCLLLRLAAVTHGEWPLAARPAAASGPLHLAAAHGAGVMHGRGHSAARPAPGGVSDTWTRARRVAAGPGVGLGPGEWCMAVILQEDY